MTTPAIAVQFSIPPSNNVLRVYYHENHAVSANNVLKRVSSIYGNVSNFRVIRNYNVADSNLITPSTTNEWHS